MWRGTEMFAHVCTQFGMCDFGEVFARPGHKLAFRLSHILGPAPGAFDAVDQVGTLTRHIHFGFV